jgi:hemerythrin superfamily protein
VHDLLGAPWQHALSCFHTTLFSVACRLQQTAWAFALRILDTDKGDMSMATTRTGKSAAGKRSASRPAKAAAPRQRDAVSILRADHRMVDDLFKQYEKSRSETRKQALVDQICKALTVHTKVEEEIFYPAVRGAQKDQDMMDEADVEHASAKELIAQLEGGKPGDDHYDAKVKVLGEYIRHHVREEQGQMFPKAQKSKLDLMQLGSEIETRKAELMGDEEPQEKEPKKSKSILSMLTLSS